MIEFLREIPLKDVVIDDEYEKNAYEKDAEYLLSLDENRLLAGFYENAGLRTPYLRYNGWENSLIAGHSLGHYLTAIAQCYENPLTQGDRKERVLNKIQALLGGLRECQTHSKGKKGFLWGANTIDPDRVELQFDNVERNKTNIVTQAWVPWYTMHKIVAGLVSVYNFTHLHLAKTILTELCDWVYERVKTWDEKTVQTVLSIEYGGMNDCLYNAYRITKKEEHLFAAHIFDETELFEKVLSRKKNVLNDLHTNTTIPKFLGAFNRYLTVGEERYLDYAKAFFDTVVERHSFVTGNMSEWEHFGKDFQLDSDRTQYNCETCAAYNMLLLARNLFLVTGDKKYADYYEKTYLNSILAAQNPTSGMATYFQPMASGFFKVYSSPFDSFWCCTGTGMEDFTKLGDSFYFKSFTSLYVNEFRSSTVYWEEKDVTMIQKASLAKDQVTRFTFQTKEPVSLSLKFRIPNWAKAPCSIAVNGTSYIPIEAGGYFDLTLTVDRNTVIEYALPMSIRAETLPDNEKALAFTYGPYVLSAKLGQENMDVGTTGVEVSVPKRAILPSKSVYFTTVKKEDFLSFPERYFTREGELSFRLNGCDKDLLFVPYFSEHTHRYGLYWYFKELSEKVDEEENREILDTVQPGYGQYENDALHQMQEFSSVGCTSDGTYRYAEKGGWFTYRMKVESERENFLIFSLKKEDNGKTLVISVGNDVIYKETLCYEGDPDLYEVKITLPAQVIERNQKEITAIGETCHTIPVSFRSDGDADSARVCDFIYIVH